MVQKKKTCRKKKLSALKKKTPTKVYQNWSAIRPEDKDPEDILADLEELAVVVDSILEASITEIEDLVIDANSMIESIKDSVEALDDA